MPEDTTIVDGKPSKSSGRREFVTPRQLGVALGVSESSIKRWCDQELLPVTRTAGGHRRITLAAVWQFLQDTNRRLVDSSALGLPSYAAASTRTLDQACGELVTALVEGDGQLASRIVLDQFVLARHHLAVVFDDVVAPAFVRIGDMWSESIVEEYQERRAIGIALAVLNDLDELIVVPPRSPVAIGATLEHDHYQLSTKMAELVLRQEGWEASTLGSHLPASTLQAALLKLQPQLFWLSCSHIESQDEFARGFRQVWSTAKHVGTSFVVGGRALTHELRANLPFSHYCQNMRHLAQLSPELFRLHAADGSAMLSEAAGGAAQQDTSNPSATALSSEAEVREDPPA